MTCTLKYGIKMLQNEQTFAKMIFNMTIKYAKI